MCHEFAIHVQAHNPRVSDSLSSSLALSGDDARLRVHLVLFHK